MLQQLVHTSQHLQQRLKADQPLSSTLSKLHFKAEYAANACDNQTADVMNSADLGAASRQARETILDIIDYSIDGIQGTATHFMLTGLVLAFIHSYLQQHILLQYSEWGRCAAFDVHAAADAQGDLWRIEQTACLDEEA